MKVIVFGASGDVGEHVIRKLSLYGHRAMAVVSNENQMERMEKLGAVEVVLYDEEGLTELLVGNEAVIYLAGINPRTNMSRTVLVDHESVIQIVKEAEKQGVRRFVMMSAVSANEREEDESREIAGKEMPDELLRHSKLVYTIVQTSNLSDRPGEGKISVAATLDSSSHEIAREDVADVLVSTLEIENTFYRTFEVAEGETIINKALELF